MSARVNLGNSSLITMWIFSEEEDWLEEKKVPELLVTHVIRIQAFR